MEENLKKFIDTFLSFSVIQKDEVSIKFDEAERTYWVSIKTLEPEYLIGPGGEHLNALNCIARRIMDKDYLAQNSELTGALNIVIDVNNFQKNRIENLKEVAHTNAERVRFFKSDIEVDPMPPQDRRIIHSYLSGRPNIKTESTGDGRNRRVIIKYIA